MLGAGDVRRALPAERRATDPDGGQRIPDGQPGACHPALWQGLLPGGHVGRKALPVQGQAVHPLEPGAFRLLAGKELNCAIYSPSRDIFYLGTLLDGIYEVDAEGNVLNHFYAGNTLQNNTVLYLYEDRQHNVWAALDRGISYIHYTPGMDYYQTMDRNVGSVYNATLWNGYLLVATNQGVFYTPQEKAGDPEMFSSLRLVEGTQGQVWQFKRVDGKLLCCHNSGLLEIGPDLSVRPAYPLNTGVFNMVEGMIGRKQIQIIVAYNALYVVDKETGRLNAMRRYPPPFTARR